MKALGVLLLCLFSASGFMIKVSDVPLIEPTLNLAPSGWVHLQKLVLPLFENVCDESKDPMIVQLSQEFVQNIIVSEFWDPEVVTAFQNLRTGNGMLAKGEIFSEFNPEHIRELKIIFDILYNAKTFDTFLKVAAWARQNVNCGLYVDAIYLAFEKRKDTEKLSLPPPYEILPNYFIRKDIIFQGSSLLAGQEITLSEGVRDEGNAYTLDANYTANFYENDDEAKLAYFREDIGLNSFYFLKMLNNAPWLNKNVDINSNYGENMYFMMKQFLSRYNMERYSNGMPEQDGINWDALPTTTYDPMLVYSNGNEFIHRVPLNSESIEMSEKVMLHNIENNIATVVTHMRESGYNKTQILNHIMEILVTNDRSYDTLARNLLGKFLCNNGNLSVLEHYMTSLRDPLFWKLNKKIVDLVDNALKVLPPYKKNELYFPGVEVVSIDAKKIMTNFDYYQFDITDALKIGNGDTTFRVKIGQQRLNHKPFTIKVNISSLVVQKGLVKIYLGPKIMPGEFAQKKNQFTLVDFFDINLKRGSNVVTRSSDDMKHYSLDFMSFKTLHKKVEDAQFGLDSLPLNSMDQQTGYPLRMIIPKGSSSGLPFQILVFVAPYVKANLIGTSTVPTMEYNTAVFSKLYPFDLSLPDNTILDLPNILMKEISVTHKAASSTGSNGGKQWNGNNGNNAGEPNYHNNGITNGAVYNNNPSDDLINPNFLQMPVNDYSAKPQGRPFESQFDYSSKKKQPYDYKANRPQYKKDDTVNKPLTVITEAPKEEDLVTETVDVDFDVINRSDKGVTGTEHFVMQGDDSNVVRSRQFGSNTDYSSKKKEFDYKAIRAKYQDKRKTYKTTTEIPKELNFDITTEEFVFPKEVSHKDDLVVEDINSVGNIDYNNLDLFKSYKKDADKLNVVPIFETIVPQKFTIYDYIIRNTGDDKDDDDAIDE